MGYINILLVRMLTVQSPFAIGSRRSQVWLQESVQAGQEQKTAAEDQSSRVTFEVEVLHFQAYLQAELAPGRFLLAAQKGRVEGRSMAHLMQNLTTLTLDQVGTAYCILIFCLQLLHNSVSASVCAFGPPVLVDQQVVHCLDIF